MRFDFPRPSILTTDPLGDLRSSAEIASLPVELIMAIVEDVDDTTLPSLCLTCRALLPVAQRRP